MDVLVDDTEVDHLQEVDTVEVLHLVGDIVDEVKVVTADEVKEVLRTAAKVVTAGILREIVEMMDIVVNQMDIADEVNEDQKVDIVAHHQGVLLVVATVEITVEAAIDRTTMIIILVDLLVEMRMVDIVVNNSKRGLSMSSFS